MRTNIELDDALLSEARRYARSRTKRGIVEEALREFVRVKADERRRGEYARRLETLRAQMPATRLPETIVSMLREDRDRS